MNLESECGAGEFEAWESAEAGRACAPCRGCAEREVGCRADMENALRPTPSDMTESESKLRASCVQVARQEKAWKKPG